VSSCSFWAWVLPGKWRAQAVALGMLGGGRRTGVHGRVGSPRAFPPHSGSDGDVTPVSPVLQVTGVAFPRASSPIWWLSCIVFCVLVSSFGIFHLLCLRTANRKEGQGAGERAGLAELPLLLSQLLVPSCYLETQRMSRLMSFPPAPPCCAVSPCVAKDDLIVLAKAQFVLSPSQSLQKALHPTVVLASAVGQMNSPGRGHFHPLTSSDD